MLKESESESESFHKYSSRTGTVLNLMMPTPILVKRNKHLRHFPAIKFEINLSFHFVCKKKSK